MTILNKVNYRQEYAVVHDMLNMGDSVTMFSSEKSAQDYLKELVSEGFMCKIVTVNIPVLNRSFAHYCTYNGHWTVKVNLSYVCQ